MVNTVNHTHFRIYVQFRLLVKGAPSRSLRHPSDQPWAPLMTLAELVYTKDQVPDSFAIWTRFLVSSTLTLYMIWLGELNLGLAVWITMSGLTSSKT